MVWMEPLAHMDPLEHLTGRTAVMENLDHVEHLGRTAVMEHLDHVEHLGRTAVMEHLEILENMEMDRDGGIL